MYLPRNLISHLYTSLLARTHPLSPPVLILVALSPDALCAARILTALLKRDYIPHKIQPVSGYTELTAAGRDLIRPLTRQAGADGGVVVCLGVGGLVDLEDVLGLDFREDTTVQESLRDADHGIEVWCLDARRPWNLQNVFGSSLFENEPGQDRSPARSTRGLIQGRIDRAYQPGRGGIVVFDDGDIETELHTEREAFNALLDMPELGDDEDFDDNDDTQDDDGDHDTDAGATSRKRKSSGGEGMSESDDEVDDRPRRRRRSNSGSAIPSSPQSHRERFELSNHPTSSRPSSQTRYASSPPPRTEEARQESTRAIRRKLVKLRRKHEAVLNAYYALGTSYSEPLSSLIYNLAEELGREDNDLLWLAIVGITSIELYNHSTPSKKATSGTWTSRSERIRAVLQDEVRRLNPLPPAEIALSRIDSHDMLPTTASSPLDTSIRLSPEPRFLLTRHWSLYESMLHSPYLSSRLHIWTENGKKRLDRLLTKMGISLDEARKGYTHMDMQLKRTLRQRLLKFAPMYGLDGLIPPRSHDKEGWSFVRSWGWRACLSASDVAIITGAILEIGTAPGFALDTSSFSSRAKDHKLRVGGNTSYASRIRSLPTPDSSPSAADPAAPDSQHHIADPDLTTHRFFAAYDALAPTDKGLGALLAHVDTAKHLHAAILRTGAALMAKHQIRHLRAFRMGVVREGPDVPLFCHPGALVKLASWVSESVGVLEAERGAKEKGALVLGALDEARGVYVVVGLGGGGGTGRVKSRAELRQREERRAKRKSERAERKLEAALKREESKRKRREREEANGIFRDEDEEDDDTEDEEEEEEDDEDDSSDDSEDEEVDERRKKRGYGLNRFGAAFLEVVQETAARVRIDSFEHSVVEVKKEDFSAFLEALSLKSVVG